VTNHPANRKRTISEESDEVESRTTTSDLSHAHTTDGHDDVELILKPHPKETHHQSQRYLKTTSNATIGHLSKYLSTRLGLDGQTANHKSPDGSLEFNLFVTISGATELKPGTSSSASTSGYQQLSANQTLEIIVDRFWKLNKPLELLYVFKNSPT